MCFFYMTCPLPLPVARLPTITIPLPFSCFGSLDPSFMPVIVSSFCCCCSSDSYPSPALFFPPSKKTLSHCTPPFPCVSLALSCCARLLLPVIAPLFLLLLLLLRTSASYFPLASFSLHSPASVCHCSLVLFSHPYYPLPLPFTPHITACT